MEDKHLSRVSKLKNIDQVITEVMNPLSEIVVSTISCTTTEDKTARFQILLGSYSAEIPEQNFMLCVKYSNHTK